MNITVDKTKFKQRVQEAVSLMIEMEAAKECIAEISKQCKEDFEVSPAEFKKIVKLHYDQNAEEQKAKVLEPFELYEELFG